MEPFFGRPTGAYGRLLAQVYQRFAFLSGAGYVHALRESICASGVEPHHDTTWWMAGVGACLPVPRARAGQRHGRIARQELTVLEDIILDSSCGEAVHALYPKVARASKFAFRAASVRLEQIFRVRHGAQHHELEVCGALAELQGTAGQFRAQCGQRDIVLGTLVPFRHLLSQRLDNLRAEATTPAQRRRSRIVQQQFVPGFERLCLEDVEAMLHTQCCHRNSFSRADSYARHGGRSGFGARARNLRLRGHEHQRPTCMPSFASFPVPGAIQRWFVKWIAQLSYQRAL